MIAKTISAAGDTKLRCFEWRVHHSTANNGDSTIFRKGFDTYFHFFLPLWNKLISSEFLNAVFEKLSHNESWAKNFFSA